MKNNDHKHPLQKIILLCSVLLNAIILKQGLAQPSIYGWLAVSLPLLAVSLFVPHRKQPSTQKKNNEPNTIQSFQAKIHRQKETTIDSNERRHFPELLNNIP